jgi:hypothetical protein
MRPPSQSDLLAAWESGRGSQSPVIRALALLSLARPEAERRELSAVSVGARDRTLLGLRESLFGPRLGGVARCEACGETLEFECMVSDLQTPEPSAETATLDAEGYALTLRPPNSVDLMEAARVPGAAAQTALLARCVTEARRDGQAVAFAALPPSVTGAAARRLADLDPQADMRLDLSCPTCGRGWSIPFDIAAYLWTELDSLAQRLMAEIHELATAYGWSEHDILALSPVRRRHYLALVRS